MNTSISEEFIRLAKYAAESSYPESGMKKDGDKKSRAHQRTFVAGAEWARHHLYTHSAEGVKWVRASERLPGMGVQVFAFEQEAPIRRGTLEWSRDDVFIGLWFKTRGDTEEIREGSHRLADLFWLEESPSLFPLKGVEKEEEKAFPDHIHVALPSGAVANVSPDASPDLLNALDKMAEQAIKFIPIEEKEVPFDMCTAIYKMWEADTQGFFFPPFQAGAISMYHKMWANIEKQNVVILRHIAQRQDMEEELTIVRQFRDNLAADKVNLTKELEEANDRIKVLQDYIHSHS